LAKEQTELVTARTELGAEQAQLQADLMRIHRLQEGLVLAQEKHESRERELTAKSAQLASELKKCDEILAQTTAERTTLDGCTTQLAEREASIKARDAELAALASSVRSQQDELRLWEKEIIERRALLEGRERQAR